MSPKELSQFDPSLVAEYERLRALIEDVPCAVWEIETTASGQAQRFTFLSKSAETLFGYPHDDLLNLETWSAMVHPEDRAQFDVQSRSVFSHGDHAMYRHRIVTADGRVIPIEAFLHLVRDARGTPVAYRGVTLDVSERYRNVQRWKFLAQASEILAESMDLEETLTKTTKLLVPEIGDLCSIHLIQPNGEMRRFGMSASSPELEALSNESSTRFKAREETRQMILSVLETKRAYVTQVDDAYLAQHTSSAEHYALVQRMNISSIMLAPLFVRDTMLGVIALSVKNGRPAYGDEDRLFLEELARRVALAIYNSQLLNEARTEAERRKFLQERMEFLAHASAVLASTVDAESALHDLIEEIVPRIADFCVVVVTEGSSNPAKARTLAMKSDPPEMIHAMYEMYEKFPVPPKSAFGLAYVLESRQPQIVLQYDDEMLRSMSQCEEHFQLFKKMDLASTVFYPLEAHEVVYGAILLGCSNASGHQYTEDDLSFFEEIARRSSMAIYKSRLLDEAREEIERRSTLQGRLELVEEVSQAVASSLNVQELLQRAAAVIAPRFADWITIDIAENSDELRRIFIYHSDSELRDKAEKYRQHYSNDITAALREVMVKNTPLYIPNAMRDSRRAFGMAEERWEALNELGVSSLIMVPLRSRRRTLGVLGLDMGHSDRHYMAADIELAKEVASRIAAGIDNALLYSEAHREIERRIELQNNLEQAKEEAEVANRTKDQFIAALSHELRTPLTPVLATVDLLSEDPDYPDSLRPFIDLIRRNIEIEARLIDDLLDMTRITKGKLRLTESDVDMHALIPDVIEICRRDLDRNKLRIVTQFHASNFYVRGDRDRLSQVLWNLLHNAIKFTPESGLITIRTKTDAADNVVIEVQDTGRGIDAADLRRIFDPFEQDANARTNSQAGLGLGLAITRTIVEMHGGTIEARSEGAGQGSTFIIRLKALEVKPSLKIVERTNGRATKNSARILMVDDHYDTNAALKVLLERRGYSVTTAASVAGGLELSRAHHFDVLVSDIGLPDGDGTDLLRAIRQERPMRAIAVSGYGTEADIERSRQAGFEYHLKKPIAFPELERAIAELLQ